ncbi:MAG TPA: hypothetical protein VG963_20840 [Polyangiaceae bacterium]|nr:hypothetical protein [Polyangiaceae bacterium]
MPRAKRGLVARQRAAARAVVTQDAGVQGPGVMNSSYVPPTGLLEDFLRAFPLDGQLAPTLDELRLLVSTMFWASLRTYEGQIARPAILLIPPGIAADAAQFDDFAPLSADDLAKLSPALRHADLYAGIGRHDGVLALWGILLAPTDPVLRIRATSPGVLHLAAGPNLLARLSGERAQLVPPDRALQFNELLTRALGQTSDLWLRSRQNDYLRHIARRILEHSRGGTLLIVPSPEGSWTNTVRIRHRFVLPVEDIVNAWRDETNASMRQGVSVTMPSESVSKTTLVSRSKAIVDATSARDRARSFSDRIGDVTAVDGAAVVTQELALLGFGAKIATEVVPPRVLEIRPVIGAGFEESSLDALGGTRHQSAARLVTAHPDCVAFVISQDGMVSLFSWLDEQNAVLVARELELLLW